MGHAEQHDDITVVWLQVPEKQARPREIAPNPEIAYSD
jgi:hypothetical protein